jgi:hypothetical protein
MKTAIRHALGALEVFVCLVATALVVGTMFLIVR